MCGICGIIDKKESYRKETILEMNESLYNRGPDGAGHHWENGVGIAMRRLSIIDLGGGWQPIFSENKQVLVVLNGEIYNYPQLRQELSGKGHRFSTNSDTEVLVHGYEEWGIEGILERIDGMYGFALWDKARQKMYLARDRFGEKPLYFYAQPGSFLFASQLLTLVHALGEKPAVNPTALYFYLGLHYVPGSITIFDKISKLLPGEFLDIDLRDAAFKRKRYWQLEASNTKAVSKDEFREALYESVRSRMIADVPVGVFLSGGLDSSVIAALAKQSCGELKTFSMGFKGANVDESEFSKLVAEHIGSDHNHFEFDLHDFNRFIPKIISTMDEPVGDQAMLPLYWLCSEAVKHVKVVLSGEGADELFVGYDYYLKRMHTPTIKDQVKRFLNRIKNKKSLPGKLFDAYNETPSGFPLLTNEAERLGLLNIDSPPDFGEWYNNLSDKLDRTGDSLRQASLCDIETWLPEDLLMKFDKMAMANSLEGRAPYLNPRLAQIAMQLPLEQRVSNGVGKIILRELAQDLVPLDIIQRRKQGFILPMRSWLANELKEELIESIRACPDDTLDKKYLEKIVTNDLNDGVNRERFLYAVLVYTKWIKHALT